MIVFIRDYQSILCNSRIKLIIIKFKYKYIHYTVKEFVADQYKMFDIKSLTLKFKKFKANDYKKNYCIYLHDNIYGKRKNIKYCYKPGLHIIFFDIQCLV